MGWLGTEITRPGPGVAKNAPPKRGLSRWWEILRRDYLALLFINTCFLAGMLPAAVLAVLDLLDGNGPLLLAAAVLTVLAGPGWTAVNRLCMQMVRDVPFFTWHYLKKAYRENLRRGLAGGVLAAAVGLTLLYAARVSFGTRGFALPVQGCLALAGYLGGGTLLFLFMQIPMVELPFGGLLRNSILLVFAGGWRSVAAILVPAAATGICIYFYNLALPALLLGGPAVLCMTSCLVYWPKFEAFFMEPQE